MNPIRSLCALAVGGMFVAGLAACGGSTAIAVDADPEVVADKTRGEIRVHGIVQKNLDRPVHGRWATKETAFVGIADGTESKDFIILLSASRAEIYRVALEEMGWRTGRRFTWEQAKRLRGFTAETQLDHYMTGDPVLCFLEFERGDATVRIPLEDVVRCRVEVDGRKVEVPYTPHFVFTGAGEENQIDSGCLYCPSDCVGALFTDNSVPVQTMLQEFLVDWDKLPPPGAKLTVIMRSIR